MKNSPNPVLSRLLTHSGDESDFATKSSLMKDIYDKLINMARLDKHVILIGEIGVGKNKLAHLIHAHSRRAEGTFYTFHCIDMNEAEFKEAFWEQIEFEEEHLKLRYDVLEQASNGILFLDQFSELSESFMLNIIDSYLQGSKQLFRYNEATAPRLILSLSQNVYQRLHKTEVWRQLLSALNPLSLTVPPLRERKEDLPDLIEKFLKEVQTSEPTWKELNISPAAVKECLNYDWPGNIRQLKNAIIQGAVLSHGNTIDCHHLPFSMKWKLPYKL